MISSAERRRAQFNASEELATLATLLQVKDFFGSSSSDFTKEWKELSQEEKDWFKSEIGKLQ